MDLVLLICVPILVAAGCLVWKLRFDRGGARQSEAPLRRREDARNWQRRYGANSLLPTNFFPPTQNEILETLYVLDHLTPGWETDEPEQVERWFLNELAFSFPTLRRAGCAFPITSAGDTAQTNVAAQREVFRARHAQINALHQLVSATSAEGEERAPFEPAEKAQPWPANAVLPMMLGGAAVLVAVLLCVVRFFPPTADSHAVEEPLSQPTLAAAPVAVEPALTPPPLVAGAMADPSPTPPLTLTASVADAKPVPPTSATPSQDGLALARQIAASKERAVAKYPALATEGSEINLRFVFRYKNLVQQNSPRLLDPNWPEQLVEECAAAAGVSAKRDGYTRVLGTPR